MVVITSTERMEDLETLTKTTTRVEETERRTNRSKMLKRPGTESRRKRILRFKES